VFQTLSIFLACVLTLGVSSSHAAEKLLRLGTLAPKNSLYHRQLMEVGEAWRAAQGAGAKYVVFPDGSQGGETELARPLAKLKRISLGRAVEVDTADRTRYTAPGTRDANQTVETDAARSIVPKKLRRVGRATDFQAPAFGSPLDICRRIVATDERRATVAEAMTASATSAKCILVAGLIEAAWRLV
jgi:hypothetical protein